ncbi:hypothetical protein AArcCO_0249 [Halalkaliarchaeum sp. AArc-CO]|nr:hypothetical protein AArcCO_0249 [Halalkaliarchaeum sp. AArc-CO]
MARHYVISWLGLHLQSMGSDAEAFKETLDSFKEFNDGNGGHYLIRACHRIVLMAR